MTGPEPGVRRDEPDHVHPTQDDRVVTGLSESVGGPVGERAGRSRWWTPARAILLMTAVCFALGLVSKTSCATETWQNGNERYSHMCYSDLPPLYTARGFAEHAWPYSDDPQVRARYDVMEYPVGISYWAWGTSWVTHVLSGSPDLDPRYQQSSATLAGEPDVERETMLFVVVNVLGFALLALLAAWLLTKVNPRRPWDAAIFALSPTLALTGIINWDLLAVALLAAALWSWATDRPLLTGVLIGLGTATKLYPLFLLGGLLVICLRDRRVRDFVTLTLAAVGTWLLTNAPAYLTGKEQWQVFWSFNEERGADLGSIWSVIQGAAGTTVQPDTINTWSWTIFGLWCLGVFAIGIRAPSTPRLAQLAFLVVAGFLLVNKVYSPQYVLWLLPLAALARPRWRDQIIWQAGEILYFATVWWYLGGFLTPGDGGEPGVYWIAILLRMACELYLVAVVVRDIWRPGHDPVQVTTTRSKAVAV